MALLGTASHLPGWVMSSLWTPPPPTDASVPTQPTATDEASTQQKERLQHSYELSPLERGASSAPSINCSLRSRLCHAHTWEWKMAAFLFFSVLHQLSCFAFFYREKAKMAANGFADQSRWGFFSWMLNRCGTYLVLCAGWAGEKYSRGGCARSSQFQLPYQYKWTE